MIALGFLGVAGNISPFILPLIVGALVDYVGLSIQQASYVASADMFGLGIGTLIWSRFILTSNWRWFALLAAALLLSGNLLCAFSDTFISAAISRFIAGLGGGLMLAIGVSGLASTVNPDRIVGVYTILVTLVASIILFVFPYLLAQSGAKGMFLAMAGLSCMAGVSSFFVPRKSTSSDQPNGPEPEAASSGQGARSPQIVRWMAVFGVFVSFFGMSLFWVYIERVGVVTGFVTSQISTGLGTAQLMGVLGAGTAAIVATRFGSRLVPVMLALGLSLLASVMIPAMSGFAFYLVAASALLFSWNMFYPYVIGIMISLDSTAKLVTYSMLMMTLGKSLSPLVGAIIVTETNYDSAYWLCVGAFVLSAVLFLPALRVTDRRLRATDSSSTGISTTAT